jgi:hypothetical protein
LAPNDERRIVQTENRLRIFLGENPGPIPRSNSLDGEHMPPEIPAGKRAPGAAVRRNSRSRASSFH